MHVSTLVLCDAATVREGLLHVLGGGISFISRPSYPAPLLSDIGIVISYRGSAKLDVTVSLREDGNSQVLAEFNVEGRAEIAEGMPPNAHGSTPMPLDARALAIPRPGNYTITAAVKGGKGQTISFTATEDQSLAERVEFTL